MLFIMVAKSSEPTSSSVNDDGSRSSLKNIFVVGRAWSTLLEDLVDTVDVGLTNAVAVRPLLAANPTETAIHEIVPFMMIGVEERYQTILSSSVK